MPAPGGTVPAAAPPPHAGAARAPRAAWRPPDPPRSRARRDLGGAALCIGLAAALCLVAFLVQGGTRLAATTWGEIATILTGSVLSGLAIVRAAVRERAWGALPALAFAGLVALTAVSIVWSVQPSDSWLEANRTLSYLFAFAGAIALGHLVRERWAAVIGGVLIATVVISGYGVATKIFPAAGESISRLREPFEYWNAVGAVAAFGVPLCLWLGARREGPAWLRALAYPSLGVLATAMLLSYSRGALLAVGVGGLAWFVLVPLRLRAIPVAAIGGVAGALLGIWTFGQRAISTSGMPLSVREDAGHVFGLLTLAMVLLTLLAGIAASHLIDRTPLSRRARRWVGAVAIALVALVPVGGTVALAVSSRGLEGNVKHAWVSLTTSGVGDLDPDRLTALGNARAQYWTQAYEVWQLDPLHGAGAGGYATASMRFRVGPAGAHHAHGYVVQTLADLGWLGLGVSMLLLAAWAVAAARAIGLRRRSKLSRERRRALVPVRAALASMVAAVIVFGVSSAIDWVWFIPGVVLLALVCAGFVAGSGPLGEQPVRRRAVPGRLPVLAALGALAIGLACSWAVWQPLRSDQAYNHALTLAEGRYLGAAIHSLQVAHDRNPLALDPLLGLATIQDIAGHPAQAQETLGRAVVMQPANPDSWFALGSYQLDKLDDAKTAMRPLAAALHLDPQSPAVRSTYTRARRAAAQQ